MAKKIKEENAVAVVELKEMNLNASTLANVANYDAASFEGVELDVTENSEVFINDIVIPKLWLMQDMSDLAKDKTRKDIESGDYIDSQSEEVELKIDGDKKFLPFIVIKTFKRWQTFKTTEAGVPLERRVFVNSEVITLDNVNNAYEFTEEGELFKRRQVISSYVLKGDDAQNGIIKPYILDFAATSKGAGRDMVSDIKILNAKKLPSYVGWFKLSAKDAVSKDGDTYYEKSVKFGGLMPEAMMPFLKDAYTDITSMIAANTIEIDDRDVREEAKQAADSANVVDAASSDIGI